MYQCMAGWFDCYEDRLNPTLELFFMIFCMRFRKWCRMVMQPYSYGIMICGSPPGVMMAYTLSFNAKIGLVDF